MKYLALSLILLLSITLIVRKCISNKTNILSINFKLINFQKAEYESYEDSNEASLSSIREVFKRDKSNCLCRPTVSPRNVAKLLTGKQQKHCTCFKLSFQCSLIQFYIIVFIYKQIHYYYYVQLAPLKHKYKIKSCFRNNKYILSSIINLILFYSIFNPT